VNLLPCLAKVQRKQSLRLSLAFAIYASLLQACVCKPDTSELCSEYTLIVDDQSEKISYGKLMFNGENRKVGECSLILDPEKNATLSWWLSSRLEEGKGMVGVFQENDMICMKLLPEWADNDISLSGRIHGDKITGSVGRWTYSGIEPLGTFIATCTRQCSTHGR